MGFEPEQQIIDITEYTIKKNYKKFAALLPNSKYGKRVLNTYRKVLNKNKLLLNKIELYELGSNDIEKNIQSKIKAIKCYKNEIKPSPHSTRFRAKL